jgi:glucose-1-phosphatase
MSYLLALNKCNNIARLLIFAKIMKILNPVHIDRACVTNIIFDWGGVITNIDYHATIHAFDKIGHKSFEKYFTHHHQDDFFKKLEKGMIGPDELYSSIRNETDNNVSKELIDNAWCAMLLDTPFERIKILKELGKLYKIFILSNTNPIHANYYNGFLKKKYGINFRGLFNKVYYSHEVGMRKPDLEIFEYVLKDSQLDPASTLFIDDTEINIDSANQTGMISLYLTTEYSFENIFKSWVE